MPLSNRGGFLSQALLIIVVQALELQLYLLQLHVTYSRRIGFLRF
jgi:hypothetical protein